MRVALALQALSEYAHQGRVVFTREDLLKTFREPKARFNASLKRLVDQGILVHAARGVYVNGLMWKSQASSILESVACALRRGETSYVSMESALSRYSVISQVPMTLIVMTTGRKGQYSTPFGGIEFIHTKRNPMSLLNDIVETGKPLPLAKKLVAYRDLKRSGRNLHLIDEDVLYEETEAIQLSGGDRGTSGSEPERSISL